MAFDFSTLVTDRAMADVLARNDKGTYNAADLNRVDECLEDLVARLGRMGYNVPGYQRVKIPRETKPTSRLPDGYTEVQYIRSTGTQYVDTGVNLTSEISLTLDWQLVTYASDKWFLSALNTTLNQGLRIGAYENAFYMQGAAASQASDLTARTIFAGESSYTVGLNLFLFSENRNGAPYGLSDGKCYSLKIRKSSELIRDYVPCISPAGAAGLYDLVDGKFYGNSGTGAFFAGPRKVTLPDGYTQVEYIKSNEAQYIDSGVPGDSDVRVVSEFDLLANSKSTSCIFGAQGTDSMRYVLCSKSAGTFRSDYGTQITTGPAATVGGHYIADKNRNICKLNGDAITSPQATFSGNSNIYLFARSYSSLSPSKINLYLCRIYKADVFTRDYIPCTNASGAAGLYDLVGQKFYGNAGTGSFTAGPVVTWEAPEEPTETLDPYTWYESDVLTVSLLARYRDNVAAVRAVLRLPEGTPEVPATLRRMTQTEANSMEAALLAIDLILNHIPAAVRHCGVTVCRSKGVIA